MAANKLERILGSDIVKYVLNTIEEGILIVDAGCRIVFYNGTLSRLEGLAAKEVVGKLLFDVFPSITPQESTLCKVMETGEPIRDWLQEYVNYQGKQIKTVNTTIPIIDKGTMLGALEVSRDISLVVSLTEKVSFLQRFAGKGGKPPISFANIVGDSPKIRAIVDRLKKVAHTTSTVLIYGETGTGKELFAQSLHNEGRRRNQPFIAQNCAALPESLLEGMLFGSTKGSFTGAVDKAGLFEQAQGGTVFLDEINSMSLSLQAKILRVLQEGAVRRLGGGEDIPVDVRFIAATNEKPAELLAAGKLREDLFYRLSVICVEIPPLRERREDIYGLAGYFINKYNSRFQKRVTGLAPEVMAIFLRYGWPGNVRELEHVVEALLNFTDSGLITAEHLKYLSFGAFQNFIERQNLTGTGGGEAGNYFKASFGRQEEKLIIEAMQSSHGNITRAAELLGMKRQALQYRLKKYGILNKPAER
ncbi:fis bacterial regulatory protein hth signature [Lucifera butyrica]|uniref:Fis bacterial regulatory protein hth signature n=2 Tax=Lucifera butyrica TaxID=1351585 RepID=A0A498RI85_9FIRM|nr:fis bacterial regulatory protein hth signature [Lucifera butyrica]